MKVLWLAPWFRTLAVAWADGLRDLGHDVVVATTEQHFDGPRLHGNDVLFRQPWRSERGLQELLEARRYTQQFAPDVVVSETVRDPRFLALGPRRCPLVLTTHDARPHDAANRAPVMRRLAGMVLDRRADGEVVFSRYVRDELEDRGRPVRVLPLTSEMPESEAPELASASLRRDFMVIGRLSAYKNIPVILEAYRRHQASPHYAGDRLVIVGAGDPGCHIPPDVEWLKGRFSFSDLAPRLSRAKASICLYSAGSQSGVQVLGAQCGVRTLVSDVGGLAEYLPRGEEPLPVDDPRPLGEALDLMADPVRAAEDGARHRQLYEAKFSARGSARQWEKVLLEFA